MNSPDADELRFNELKQRRMVSGLLLFFCVLGAALRIAVAYNSGIWADEGAFLLLVQSPSWRAMIEFLRLHESHPPFFYALMRLWMSAFGPSDNIALALPVAISIAVVPAVFVFARRLFSRRVALIATMLAAISPALVEYSTQFRPYGLLPLLTLVSCYALIVAVDRGGLKRWIAYVVSTVLLLYTHNWSWLLVFGEVIAVSTLFIRPVENLRRGFARELIASLFVVGLMYAPWLPTLLYQSKHAGHAGVTIESAMQGIGMVSFAVPAAVVMVVLGSLANATLPMWITTIAFMAGAGVLIGRSRSATPEGDGSDAAMTPPAAIAIRVIVVVPIASTVAAILLSPLSNLLIPRCLAMLTPLVLIAGAKWIDGARWFSARTARATVPVVLGVGVVVMSIFSMVSLIQTPRSNVREVAAELRTLVRPDDMIIVAPEWYAASLNHYFPQTVEQIDFPYEGRSGLVDFSDVFSRISNPEPLASVRGRIEKASAQGRRVWLLSDRHYVRGLTDRDLRDATVLRQAPAFSVIRVQQIRDALREKYGEPDTTLFVRGRTPRDEDVLPFLYSPRLAR